MSTDADLIAKAAALAPTKKKKAGAVLPPGGEPAQQPAQPGPGSLICQKCGSPYIVYNGKSRHGKDRLKCADCNKSFNAPPEYVHHKQPANTFIDHPTALTPDAPQDDDDNATNAQLNDLQAALSKLSKKALRKLNALLDDPNARVQMQAALGTIRSTVQALTRDTSSQGDGAEIHIHTSQTVAIVNPSSPGGQAHAPNPHEGMSKAKAIGHPIAIVK